MSSATELLSAAVNMHVGLFYNSNSESVACLFVVSAKFLYTECAFPPRSSFLGKVNGAGEENRAPTTEEGSWKLFIQTEEERVQKIAGRIHCE